MPSVKIKVSLDESLFQQMEEVAREMQKRPSTLLALAVEKFLRYRKSRQLEEALHTFYTRNVHKLSFYCKTSDQRLRRFRR